MAAEEEKSRSNTNPFILFLSLAVFIRSAKASWEDHRYNAGDPVPFFVNKVGPLNNPSETYWYYDLPFCRPDQVIKKEESLGEVLNGDRLTNAKYKLNFREDKDSESICKKTLSMEEVTKFRDAIKKDYYYQMYYDDLPLWGFVGKAEESMETMNETEPRYYLFNHIQFNVIFNQNQVIEISAFSDPSYVVNVTDNAETEAEFMYSVRWSGTPVHFGNRMDKYSQKDRQEDKEEVGWKNVHGDVFRYPPYKSLLCGVLGTGIQLLILVLFIFVLAFMGSFYPHNRGAMFSSLFIVYALTSVVAGYTSSSLHTQWGGMIPIKNMLLTLFLFPGPLFVIFSVLNTIAIIHNATAALPFDPLQMNFKHLVPPKGFQQIFHHYLDYKWWWRSVLCGGSTSIFVYGYCCYFYAKSQMTGLLQFSFFFGNNACICYAFFLMLGTVAFCTSLIFVRHIYRAIKSE
ncbi:hypothetical protein AAC387_Pa05g2829 [Persea americana]